jgi:prepilin-type processing-associated H-X9-DG protein
VFATAREKARQTTCASNEKQIGLAMAAYAQDFDETFTFYIHYGGTAWDQRIQPYYKLANGWGSTDPFLTCPDDQLKRVGSNTRTYALAGSGVVGGPLAGAGFVGPPLSVGSSIYRGRQISEFPKPSTTLMIVENPHPNNVLGNENNGIVTTPGSASGYAANPGSCQTNDTWNCGQDSGVLPYHNGGWNYAFVDGHVKWFRPEQTAAPTWKAGVWGCAGGFWTLNNTTSG